MIIGVVASTGTVARSENKHRALSITAVFNTLAQSFIGEGQRRAVEVIRKRTGRAPAVVADVELVLQSQRLGDLAISPGDPGRDDLRIGGDADDAGLVVLRRADDAGHCRAMGIPRVLVATVLRIELCVIGQRKVDPCLQIRVRGVDAVVDHADGDTGTSDLAIQLVYAQRRQIPLRRLQGICHATIELAQPHGVSAGGGAIGANVEVVDAAARRRDHQMRVLPGTRVVVAHQLVASGVEQAQRRIGQVTADHPAAARTERQHINDIDLASHQIGADPVTVAGIVDRACGRCAGFDQNAGPCVSADVIGQGRREVPLAGIELISPDIARRVSRSHGEVIEAIIENRYCQIDPAGVGRIMAHGHQGDVGVEQAQRGLGQSAQAIAKTLDREVVDLAFVELDREQIGIGGAADLALTAFINGKQAIAGKTVATDLIRVVIDMAAAQIDDAQLVLSRLVLIARIDADAHPATAGGGKARAVEQGRCANHRRRINRAGSTAAGGE